MGAVKKGLLAAIDRDHKSKADNFVLCVQQKYFLIKAHYANYITN